METTFTEVPEIKLNPEDARVVTGILKDAQERMRTAASALGGLGDVVHTAYTGAGTGQAVENYGALGKSGRVLGDILEQLETDFTLVITSGEEMDLDAQGVVNGVNINTISPDSGIVAGI
ncbi:hypothetical protein [Streptomyces sp. NPDC049879]|uniref:hypothetical protein n=1 Tax=Streptomyces sp. NPDC049879 TaxID=3365598 RepID=UPI00379AD17E